MEINEKQKHVYLKDLHFEHKVWLNELKFYAEELSIFKNRLGELVVRYSKTEVLARVEQFQNQFIREKEVIDELSHKIRENENKLAEFAAQHPTAIEHKYFEDHVEIRDEINRFRELFIELKRDFFKYLSKHM